MDRRWGFLRGKDVCGAGDKRILYIYIIRPKKFLASSNVFRALVSGVFSLLNRNNDVISVRFKMLKYSLVVLAKIPLFV